jgi:hypothetical protein
MGSAILRKAGKLCLPFRLYRPQTRFRRNLRYTFIDPLSDNCQDRVCTFWEILEDWQEDGPSYGQDTVGRDG